MYDVIAIPSAVKTEIEETDASQSISAQPPELGKSLSYPYMQYTCMTDFIFYRCVEITRCRRVW